MNGNAIRGSISLALVGFSSAFALLVVFADQAVSLPQRAALFPQVLLGLIGLSFVIVVAMEVGLWWRRSGKNAYALGGSGYAAAATLVAGAFAIAFLGFYLTTTFLHLAFFLICVRPAFKQHPVRELVSGLKFALIMSAINWFVFDYLLELSVPAGILF